MKKIIFVLSFAVLSTGVFAGTFVKKNSISVNEKEISNAEDPKKVESCNTVISVITGPEGSGWSVSVSCTKCATDPGVAHQLASICAQNLVNHIVHAIP